MCVCVSVCVCVCVCVCGCWGGGGGGAREEELTDCGEEGREVGGGGRGESRVMRWWG